MPEPVPILFTIPNFITAGSGRAMLNIIERLNPRKFAPAVCVLRKGGDLDRVVEQLRIPFLEASFTVPGRPYHLLFPRAWSAARFFRPHRFVLWHSFHYLDDYTEPVIARIAGAKAWIHTKKNMNWHRRAWYLRSILSKRIMAQNSDMIRDFFSSKWLRSKVDLVPRGVDTDYFSPSDKRQLNIRAELRIADNSILIGCLAHLVPVKGHPTLIKAMARFPNVHLLLAGKPLDDDYVRSVKALVQELKLDNRVHFLGNVRDAPAFLAEIDICVLPTWGKWRMEGCPVALLEAMSCSKACIATDIPGSRDLIEDRISGRLVPPENTEELARALTELVHSPELRLQFGEESRRRVIDHFSIEREVTAHEAVYDEILDSLGHTKH